MHLADASHFERVDSVGYVKARAMISTAEAQRRRGIRKKLRIYLGVSISALEIFAL
jgi:hypothetical protein